MRRLGKAMKCIATVAFIVNVCCSLFVSVLVSFTMRCLVRMSFAMDRQMCCFAVRSFVGVVVIVVVCGCFCGVCCCARLRLSSWKT